MDYTAVILAGGKSSRFGKDKTMLKIDGEPIVKVIINKCRPFFSEILLVSNSRNKHGMPGMKDVEEISDIYKGKGPLGGIHAGLAAADNQVCFVAACDMPFFYAPLAGYLLEQSEEYDVVVPRELNGHLQPLFAVYKKDLLPKIEWLLLENESSILKLYEIANVRYVDEREWKEVIEGNEDVFYNVNYPEDYERLFPRLCMDSPNGLEAAVELPVKKHKPPYSLIYEGPDVLLQC